MYAFQDKQTLGVWTVTGSTLQARTFDGGATFYLTQVEPSTDGTDRFFVRGRNMLNRADVTLTSGLPSTAYVDLAGGDTDVGGLVSPAFPTPANYTRVYKPSGDTYYMSNGTSDCTLTNGLQVGTFTPTGHPLEVYFSSGKWYVYQVVARSPMEYIVRGKNILKNANFATLTRPGCYDAISSEESAGGGAQMPNSYTTPDGFKGATYNDGTVYFKATSGAGLTTPPFADVYSPTGLAQNGNYTYVIAPGQQIVLRATGSLSQVMKWWTVVDGYEVPYSDPIYGPNYAALQVTPPNGYGFFLETLDSAGNRTSRSNTVYFVNTGATAQQSATPSVDAATIPVGQPIAVHGCPGGVLTVKVNANTLPSATITADSTGKYIYTPSIDSFGQGVNPTVGQVFHFTQKCPGQTDSNEVTVTYIENPANKCNAIVDGSALGLWGSTHVLKARKFTFNGVTGLWVTEVATVPGGPDAFIVRGKNILSRGDVTTEYKACTASFQGSDSGVPGNFPGLAMPAEFPTTVPGYTRKTYPTDGTVYYEATTTTASVPVPQISTAASMLVGQTIQGAAGEAGTIKVYKNGSYVSDITGVNGAFTYIPASAGAYTFVLQNAAGNLSNASTAVTVSVGGTGGTGACTINDLQQVGTASSGEKLIARFFNGKMWLTQQTQVSPDQFVVRGANFIERSDVTSNYKGCKSSFAGGDTGLNTGYPGFPMPADFVAPSGYSVSQFDDGTKKFTSTSPTGGGGVGGGNTDTGTTPGSDTSANPGSGATTAIFTPKFKNTCGNPMDYAVSKTIADPKNVALKWQTTPDFSLESGLYYFHARERGTSGSTQKDYTIHEICTV